MGVPSGLRKSRREFGQVVSVMWDVVVPQAPPLVFRQGLDAHQTTIASYSRKAGIKLKYELKAGSFFIEENVDSALSAK